MATKKKQPEPTTTIQNCSFTGAHWDAKAVEAVQTVAQALLNLTALFRSQGVTMDAMVKIVGADIAVADSKVRM